MTTPGSITRVDRHEAGFTLVELLVALSLLSLVSLALFTSLRFGILAWGRSAAHTERLEHIAHAQNLLRRLISDAYPLFLNEGPNRGRVAFEGTATSLRFLASSPVALGNAGRSWFTLVLDQQGGRAHLMLMSIPELADRHDSSTLLKRVFIANVDRVDFSYFGKSRAERNVQWRDRWTDEPSLPELVRIRIDFPAGDGRVWPELSVRPRITADVGCAYDILSKRCRGR
jgi:general secretion pathway protein J